MDSNDHSLEFTKTDRIFPKRIVDPIRILGWIGAIRTSFWMLKQLQRLAESRRVLLFGMKAVRWLTIIRYSLPRRKLPTSWHSVGIPLKAIGSPFLNLMNGIYLHLACKYDPMAWYAWDSLFPWSVNWELPSTFNSLRFTLGPIQFSKPIEMALTPIQPMRSADGTSFDVRAVIALSIS